MILFIIITLTILLVSSIYANINLLKNIEVLENFVENQAEEMNRLRVIVIDMRNELKAIDKRGSFESDDEVGFFFKQLKSIIERINNFFDTNYKEQNAEKE
jgi:cell division protein FtsB